MKKLRLAVIGKDVSKSSSPAMHSFIAKKLGADISYDNISVPPEEFSSRAEGFFKEYDGFNVTIPFKLKIIPFLDGLEGDAKAFGAVNTVVSATRKGYNTDGLGFMLMLQNSGVHAEGKTVLLLGAGGAGRSAAKKLKQAGADVTVYDKNVASATALAKEDGLRAIKSIEQMPYDIIINATGVGMHKTVGLSPVGKDILTNVGTAVDLIYEPRKSAFLELSESLGKKTVNGGAMLFYQAYYAECIFFGARPDDGQAAALYNKYQGERQ